MEKFVVKILSFCCRGNLVFFVVCQVTTDSGKSVPGWLVFATKTTIVVLWSLFTACQSSSTVFLLRSMRCKLFVVERRYMLVISDVMVIIQTTSTALRLMQTTVRTVVKNRALIFDSFCSSRCLSFTPYSSQAGFPCLLFQTPGPLYSGSFVNVLIDFQVGSV